MRALGLVEGENSVNSTQEASFLSLLLLSYQIIVAYTAHVSFIETISDPGDFFTHSLPALVHVFL